MNDAGATPAATSDIAPGAGSAAAGGAGSTTGATTTGGARGPIRSVLGAAIDGVRTILFALFLSFAIRVVIVEPFHIPSQSMEPTLVPGDYIGAVKFPYGWSHVSTAPIPLPERDGRLFGRNPGRGDLIVFRNPLDGGADYVKRVIGLPGDRVQMRGGVLHVNGEAAPTVPLHTFDGVDPIGRPVSVTVSEETLPGGCAHLIQHFEYADGHEEGQDDTYEFLVPDGEFFVMGDNRDASYDSRLPGRVGYVAAVEIVGRAEFVFMSVGEGGRDPLGAAHASDGAAQADAAPGLPEGASSTTLRLERTLKPLHCP
jgi:signal peptidase I